MSGKTLFLDAAAWDLALDSGGNIAVATSNYSLAQDAASAIRTFQGECYYDTRQGLPYWTQILDNGQASIAVVKAQFVAAALTVPGVASAQVYFSGLSGRNLTGQVQVTDSSGIVSTAEF